MLTLVSGPPGLDLLRVARAIERAHRPGVWVAYDGNPEPTALPAAAPAVVVSEPPYEALAALAQRLAHPTRSKEALTIATIDCLRGEPAERAVRKEDFTDCPVLLNLAAMAATGQPLPSVIVVHTLSRLYEHTVSRVLARAAHLWGERGLATSHALASNALAHLTYDLSQAQTETVITAWEVETTMKGKVSGLVPGVPKGTMGHIALWLRIDDKGRVKVQDADPVYYEGKGTIFESFEGTELASLRKEPVTV